MPYDEENQGFYETEDDFNLDRWGGFFEDEQEDELFDDPFFDLFDDPDDVEEDDIFM